MIVLDTHVWVWWANNPAVLSRPARRAIDTGISQKGVYISAVSVLEIALLAAKERLQLTMDTREWIARSEALPFFHFVPIDNGICLRSTQLRQPIHADPADRIIVATALGLGATLITKDRRLRKYPYVRTLW